MPHLSRIGAVAALTGAPLLFVCTLLHPMNADPNDAAAAFAEYAADSWWIATHLGQFIGVALLGVALVALAAAVEPGRPAAWARIGAFGTAASVAAAAALQAVDGIALKKMVDHWAQASGDARARAYEATFAVRQVEIGLASLTSLTFGLTIVVFGVALLCAGDADPRSPRWPKWIGWLGLAGGAGTIAAGVAQAYTGFSALAMMLSMPASLVLLVWAIVLGAVMWRRSAPYFRIS